MRQVCQEVLLHAPVTQTRAPPSNGAADEVGDLGDVKRLGNVIEHPVPQPADGGVEGAVAGDDDDLNVRVELLDALHDFYARHRRHAQIQSHHVDGRRVDNLQCLLTTVGSKYVVRWFE